MHTHSHNIILVHINCGVQMCGVQYAVCGCAAFEFMRCAAVCGRAHSYVWQCGSVRGSVRLSSGAAVCYSPFVSIFSHKFKTDSFEFV
jgi:hypothetical protein